MSGRLVSLAARSVLVLFVAGCASQAPVVPLPPAVRVTQLDSILITPELVKFQAKVVIDNRMRGGLDLEKVVYGADLHDNPIFTDSFAELHHMKPRGQQTVTFPFQIAMSDIAKKAVDVLAEEALRVSFRGEVYPIGFDPVPFQAARAIPIPRIPEVSIDGVEGSPMDRVFTVFLKLRNTNCFPLKLKSVDSYLEINGKRYGLLRLKGAVEVAANASERFCLTMEQSTGKTLSMVLNIAQSGPPHFGIGGSLSCNTPFGLFHIPLQLSSEPATSSE